MESTGILAGRERRTCHRSRAISSPRLRHQCGRRPFHRRHPQPPHSRGRSASSPREPGEDALFAVNMSRGRRKHGPTGNRHPISPAHLRPTFPCPHLVELAAQAEAKGVGQLWVTDNLRSRQSFVVLAAMASRLKVKLGTAVTVQYFRNPVDLADSIATLSELMGRAGIKHRSGPGQSPHAVADPYPTAGQHPPGNCPEPPPAPG